MAKVTSRFLASVVVIVVTTPVLESVLRVTYTYSILIRFRERRRPVPICRRVAVVPLGRCRRRSSHLVQTEPVLARRARAVQERPVFINKSR